MKLKSWLENHIYTSKKRNIRKLVKPEAKPSNSNQKDGKSAKRDKAFITFPRFYKAQPLLDQTLVTEKDENFWEANRSNGASKVRKNVITTDFNINNAPTSLYSHPNYMNYYYTIDDEHSKSSKSWYFATPPSQSYRSETISSDNVIKNRGAYTGKKKCSRVSTLINEDSRPALHYGTEKKRSGDYGNFMLPNFSYDSTAICLESSYTGDDQCYEIPYKPKEASIRRRMMIRTNPWFDYSRIDTSGYSVSDESFTSNNAPADNYLANGCLSIEPNNKSLNYEERRSSLWTSTLKNELCNAKACNGDSGFYDDIRDLRATKFTSLYNNKVPDSDGTKEYLHEMTSIIDHTYDGDPETTINFVDEGNYYFTINDEDSGCSNTNSWSYRSSGPSSNCEDFNNDTWERSTSVSCERPSGSEKQLCNQALSRSESHKMSPTSAKNKIINNIMYWDRNHKELLNKLKDYRNKIKENKRYLDGKVYLDCRRQLHKYPNQSGEGVNTSNVMIYEMDPIIYI